MACSRLHLIVCLERHPSPVHIKITLIVLNAPESRQRSEIEQHVTSTGARSIPVLLTCDNSRPGEQKPSEPAHHGYHYVAAFWFYHCRPALDGS